MSAKYFQMPPRNVIPKPLQKPHPPVWVACSRQETIVMAGKLGLGVLTFGFLSPVDAQKWTADYYRASVEDCQPLAYSVNPNVAFLSGFACYKNGDLRAADRELRARQFFGHAFRHHYVDGVHYPAKTDLWEDFKKTPPHMLAPIDPNNECMGTPDDIRKVLLNYEAAGVDQVIFICPGRQDSVTSRSAKASSCSARLSRRNSMSATKSWPGRRRSGWRR